MSTGIEIRDQFGTLTYSTDDVTWNQLDFFYAPANTTVTNVYPILSGREFLAYQVMIDPPPLDRKAIAHTITRRTDQITIEVSGGSENTFVLLLMR